MHRSEAIQRIHLHQTWELKSTIVSAINDIIRKRRSVYPAQYIDKPIPKEIINELLLNANHAPTHKLTEPWRFKVFLNEGKKALGNFLAEKYREITPSFAEAKFEKIKSNPQKAGSSAGHHFTQGS